MPLYIGVFLCFPSRARVGACERAREGQGSRARSARALAAEIAQRWGRWRGRSGRPLAPSLSLVSLALLPSLLAPLPVGFCSRSSRLGGSAELAFQVPRLVSAIPPRVSQSAAEGCRGLAGVAPCMGARLARWARPARAPIINYSAAVLAAVGPRGRWARLQHAPLLAPVGRSLACAPRPRPRLAPCGARALVPRARRYDWRYLRFSKYQMSLS